VQGRLFALVSAENYDRIFGWGIEITHRDEREAVIYRRDPTTRRAMHAVHESAEAARACYTRLLPVELALVWMDDQDQVEDLLALLDAEPSEPALTL
jgi:hypothetical protein